VNRLILKRSHSSQTQFSVRDEDVLSHLKGTLKVSLSDTLKATFLDEGLGEVRVLAIHEGEGSNSIELQLEGEITPTLPKPLHLLIGVSRPPTMKKVIEHATSMGVTHFHFFKAELSEKSYLQSKTLEAANLSKLLSLGISQSAQISDLPVIDFYSSLSQAFQSLPEKRFLLSLKASRKFSQVQLGKDSIALAIGPERGWTSAEEDLLEKNNFIPIKISSHTLRVEIATFSALGQVEMLRDHGE